MQDIISSCYNLINLHKLKKLYKILSMNNEFHICRKSKKKDVYFVPHGLGEFSD